MILADTSVWINHLRSPNSLLNDLLGNDQIVMHPFVVGEIALGSLTNRTAALKALDSLPRLIVADIQEVRFLIERNHLYSRGIGWLDANLLASALINPSTQLFTYDKRLAQLASENSIPLHPGSLPN